MKKPGRPAKQPTIIISVPVDCVKAVRAALGRPVAPRQVAIVKIRVTAGEITKVRKAIAGVRKCQ